MKKIIISLLAIVALAACSKEEPQKKEYCKRLRDQQGNDENHNPC